MTEWREIEGFDGRYQVSRCGVVRSRTSGEWRNLTLSMQTGYHVANFWKDGKTVRKMVHQLVARAFIGPPPDGMGTINHIDGNKLNNDPSNLEWCTNADNIRHAWRTGLCRPPKLTRSDVLEILTCGGLDTPTAARFGVSQVLVTKIRAGQIWRSVTGPFFAKRANEP
jgi:hypothetical protein